MARPKIKELSALDKIELMKRRYAKAQEQLEFYQERASNINQETLSFAFD